MNMNNEHKILLFFKLILIILAVKTRQRIRIIEVPFIILLLKIYKEDPIKLIVEWNNTPHINPNLSLKIEQKYPIEIWGSTYTG